jgi:hypothetical protein
MTLLFPVEAADSPMHSRSNTEIARGVAPKRWLCEKKKMAEAEGG